MKEQIIKLETVTRPGIPNVNNVIYSKEAIDKAIKNFEESDRPLYLTDIPYPDMTKSMHVSIENILGEVQKIDYDSIEVKTYSDKLEKIKEYINNGYKPGMRYLANIKDNIASNIKIISFGYDKRF